jgi:hypothetical protein
MKKQAKTVDQLEVGDIIQTRITTKRGRRPHPLPVLIYEICDSKTGAGGNTVFALSDRPGGTPTVWGPADAIIGIATNDEQEEFAARVASATIDFEAAAARRADETPLPRPTKARARSASPGDNDRAAAKKVAAGIRKDLQRKASAIRGLTRAFCLVGEAFSSACNTEDMSKAALSTLSAIFGLEVEKYRESVKAYAPGSATFICTDKFYK